MSRYNELLEEEALSAMEAEKECKVCGEVYDSNHTVFIEDICPECFDDYTT